MAEKPEPIDFTKMSAEEFTRFTGLPVDFYFDRYMGGGVTVRCFCHTEPDGIWPPEIEDETCKS